MRITLTRKGSVPPWYGWASLLCLILTPFLVGLFEWLQQFGLYGHYAQAVIGSSCVAFSANFALQAVTDAKQRKLGIVAIAIYFLMILDAIFLRVKT